MVYTQTMANSSKASAAVIAAAVVALLASLLFLLSTSMAFLAFSLGKLPNTSPELPPPLRTVMLVMMAFMICLSIVGIATGIGLILLKDWARISVLIWGGFSVFFGLLGIPIIFLMPLSVPPGAAELPPGTVQMMRWAFLAIYGLPLVVGVWWLLLFNRKAIKAQFAGTATSPDSGVPQKPRCPLPITVLAWLYVTSILNLLFLPLVPVHAPVFLFGILLSDRFGPAVLILSCLAFTVAGVGLLKLKRWSYSLTLGLQVFWLTSSAVSMLRPDYKAVMQSFMKQVEASLHLPESQFSANPFMQHFGWFVAFGMLFAGAILGLLIYHRERFLEAASAAASSR
jgi:hypothetical protein